jgi:D-alanyl-D-alanine carboxypeptidase
MAKPRRAPGRRRFIISGGLLASLLVGGLALLAPLSSAQAGKPTTWIVIDASDGHVLSQNSPDALNYPASLTKMMTLFLTFSALERHRIALDRRFVVTRHAAAQAPSKLGLRPDSTISVHDLILAVVTHSANDAAVVLAEGLSGSEAAFAVRMNNQARALGMTRTNFRNASGLPDRFQYTTARDLSKLALALYRTFPREYAYFATESFTYNGETYGNHNHLMEAFQGMDGIKTGFINASGFNLAASAVRNNRRLIGVIMGGRTAESRDMNMAELLDDAFAHRGQGVPRAIAVASSETPEREVPHLRNGDSLSSIVAAMATPAEAAPETGHRQHHFRAARADRRRHGHRSVQFAQHRRLRHGVDLASAEPRGSRAAAHHRQIASASRHRHQTDRRYAGRRHDRHLASTRHAGKYRYAALHHRNRSVRSANAAKYAGQRTHGIACGGWNGNNQPCPAGLRRPTRRDALRAASIGRNSSGPAS